LGAYKRELVEHIGGFRTNFDGSQDYDLALRCIEHIKSHQIHHIPRVLYHWRSHENNFSCQNPIPSKNAGLRALNEHLERRAISAHAESTDVGYRVIYNLPTNAPLVSLRMDESFFKFGSGQSFCSKNEVSLEKKIFFNEIVNDFLAYF
jgi:hypothetical protein